MNTEDFLPVKSHVGVGHTSQLSQPMAFWQIYPSLNVWR
jgi:hypothetical protein